MITTSERSSRFAASARDAIETKDGAGALDAICRAYSDDTLALEARYGGALADLTSTTVRLRTSDDMVRTLHSVVADQLLRSARLEAYNQQLGRVLSRVRTLTATARDTDAPAAPEVAATLVTELLAGLDDALGTPLDVPEFMPVVVAFVPEPARGRVGHFESEDGAVQSGYPMVGWSLVVRHQDESRRLEPTFLVGDRALPESTIRDMYGMRLHQLL